MDFICSLSLLHMLLSSPFENNALFISMPPPYPLLDIHMDFESPKLDTLKRTPGSSPYASFPFPSNQGFIGVARKLRLFLPVPYSKKKI
ncbi:hypothetical protein VNO80_21933 [Phaseolus coccineus]|uniref:Uncharacterized protein n=1 Tax=Phaseolus coccineus TaxID=3886 RepID=A0AAN9QY71_PHACN